MLMCASFSIYMEPAGKARLTGRFITHFHAHFKYLARQKNDLAWCEVGWSPQKDSNPRPPATAQALFQAELCGDSMAL